MAKIDFSDIDKYAKRLDELYRDEKDIVENVVYKGAAVVADEIKAAIKTLPVEDERGTEEKKLKGVSKRQKADLINSFGLAPMRNDNGEYGTKAGFDGYGSVKTKKYPKGVPNALLARSVDGGTSFRAKTGVIRKASTRAKPKALKAMEEEMEKQIRERMG